MNVLKKSISLPEESFTQLEYLRKYVFHASTNVPLSQLISMAICSAYDEARIKETRARAGDSPACACDDFDKYII